ncbi:class I SAM-dependent methyltransferase [Pedobacter gandavensis]|uniref:class I SAM-dependent methyltransferase n=1 Tax=Pedobacter gandavensis TaxID=2679963 RepID=UPI00292D28C4|nr:class I SAM-dependent methyltransferase [Pedobacter gandavensis]
MKEKKPEVIETYNIIADWFSENRDQGLIEKPYLDQLMDRIGPTGSILDLGCGTGMPMMSYLLERGMTTTGVEGSSRMLDIAKKNLPQAEYIQSDMRQLSMDRKFDAIISWNSFFHLPIEDQPGMFRIFKDHLNPNGILLFTSGKVKGEAWGMNGGENLFHASLDKTTYMALLEKYHFQVLAYHEDNPECGYATIWLAQLLD